jgi:hypothetical protein
MIDKCDHGNYIPAGETKAIYCTGCNQGPADRPLRLSMSRPRLPMTIDRPEPVLDAIDFMEQAPSARLKAMEMMFV